MQVRTIVIATLFTIAVVASLYVAINAGTPQQHDETSHFDPSVAVDPLAGVPTHSHKKTHVVAPPEEPKPTPEVPKMPPATEQSNDDAPNGSGGGPKMDPHRIPDQGLGFKYVGNSKLQFGKPRLVKMVMSVSAKTYAIVAHFQKNMGGRKYPEKGDVGDPTVAIDDANKRHGGPVVGHLSHDDGRHVDIGYYYRKSTAQGGGVRNEIRSPRKLPTETRKETVERHGKKIKWPKRYLTRLPKDWDVLSNWLRSHMTRS